MFSNGNRRGKPTVSKERLDLIRSSILGDAGGSTLLFFYLDNNFHKILLRNDILAADNLLQNTRQNRL